MVYVKPSRRVLLRVLPAYLLPTAVLLVLLLMLTSADCYSSTTSRLQCSAKFVED